MEITLIVIGWLICGVLAQGMCRYNFVKISQIRIYKPSAWLLWALLACGLLGLLGAVIICASDRTWGLKFRYKE